MQININRHKDLAWLSIYTAALLTLGVWDILYLNGPALKLVARGFFNSMVIAMMTVIFTLMGGWIIAITLNAFSSGRTRSLYMLISFMLNLIRSVPQVVGVLFGYVAVGMLIEANVLKGSLSSFTLLALGMSIVVVPEVVDLFRDRIAHFKSLDFYNAMRLCGISEGRIVNVNIIWNNSRVHVLNKLIAVFGSALFLQCSVDFVISVGLSTDVNAVTLPTTLGSLLANIDSKQDILAIGHTLTHPLYAPNLLYSHLQGLSVAFLIVFTLLCVYNISNGFAQRHKL